MTKRMIKKILGVVGLILLIIIIYHFLFGRFFPWSPIKSGYKQLPFSKAVVILPENQSLPEGFRNINKIVSETEQFHRLKFNKNVKIILPKTHSQYTKFSGKKEAVACAYTGTVIYLSPMIKKKNRNLINLLKHELSHCILFQQIPFFNPLKKQRPGWLVEGLAIYYGNSLDYYKGEEFLRLAVDKGYFLNILNPDEEAKKIPGEYIYKFMYAEFRHFIEYIVDKYGIESLLKYMKMVIRKPDLEKELFYQVFNVELEKIADDFKNDVLEKKWPNFI